MGTKRMVRLGVLFFAIIALLIFQLNFLNNAKRSLPDALCFYAKNGVGINFDQAEQCNNLEITTSVEATKTSYMNTQNINNKTRVELVLTNSNYAELTKLNIRYGNYFTVIDGAELNRYVVISDELAINFFQTDKAVGKIILIDETEYVICGVYTKSKGLLNSINSIGVEQVYLPYKAVTNYQDITVSKLFSTADETNFVESLVSSINIKTRSSLMYDTVSNYHDTQKVLMQSSDITWFCLGITVVILLLLVAYKRAKKLSLEDQTKKQFFKCIGIIAGLLLVSFIIFKLVCFDFYIPNDILPYDNIFDFKFYYETIVMKVNIHNGLGVFDKFWSYSMGVITISSIYTVVNCTAIIVLFLYSFRLIKEKWDIYN